MRTRTRTLVKVARYDVAIVGYGPTGAVLANLLAICGLRVLVLEREVGIYLLPRAVHFDDETMRVFQTIGIAEALCHKIRVNPGMQFVDKAGEMLLDWPRPQKITQQGWHASYRFHQPDLEVLLRQSLHSRSNVTVKTATEMLGLTQKPDQVAIQCRDIASGKLFAETACYVVGCDGARSTVRAAMGAVMEDLGFNQSWLVVDVLLKREMPELGDHSVQFCDVERPMTYCRSPQNRRRWEITMQPGETAQDMTDPDRVWHFLSRWITPEDADLERSVVYTFQSALAENWRKDRLLLAGDAAHLTPPFMGQGMCSGIRDAANLAWKLTLELRGQAAPELLDSYTQERRPHMQAYIETAIDLGHLINSIDRGNAEAPEADRPQDTSKMASITPCLGEAGARCFDLPNSPQCGKLFGQPSLGQPVIKTDQLKKQPSDAPQKLDDCAGYRPVLIARKPLKSAWIAGQGPLFLDAQTHPALSAALDSLGVNAVLIRPDRYILATATSDLEISALANADVPSPLALP